MSRQSGSPAIIKLERIKIMITDSFDNKTEPVFTLKDFYGERKMMLDTCIIIFSIEIYETVLTTYSCTKITEINAPNG